MFFVCAAIIWRIKMNILDNITDRRWQTTDEICRYGNRLLLLGRRCWSYSFQCSMTAAGKSSARRGR